MMERPNIFCQYRHKSHLMVAVTVPSPCPVNIPVQRKVNDALTGVRCCPFPQQNKPNVLDSLVGSLPPVSSTASPACERPSLVSRSSHFCHRNPPNVCLAVGIRTRRRELGLCVSSVLKNKLIHAELNSRVQLSNKKLPSGSINFDVFMKKNWEPLEKAYIFTQELQFKVSCRLVPGGQFPFREQYCPEVQGLWLRTHADWTKISSSFPLLSWV